MTRKALLDLYFIDARARLLDLAAFLDRLDRGTGPEDYRAGALRSALAALQLGDPERVKAVLTTLSDPTIDPVEKAHEKGASGAWEKL